MFDNKIPVYWDYNRDPDNYFEGVNGYTKTQLNNYTLATLGSNYKDLKTPTYENFGKTFENNNFFVRPSKNKFRSWNVNTEAFVYLIRIEPFLAYNNTNDPEDKALLFWRDYVEIHPEVLDLICNQKRGKICLYNNWEAWSPQVYNNIIEVLCKRYENLQPVDFIICSCNELLSRDQSITHTVTASLLSIDPFEQEIQDNIINGIKNKELRKNNFICLNRVNRFHRMAAFAELWQDREYGIISQMCVQYGKPGVDEFQSIAGMDHTGQEWVDYIKNIIKTNDQVAWNFKKGLQERYPESYAIYEKQDLINQMPYMLQDDISPIINPVPDPNTQKFFDSSLNIVTETMGDIEDGSVFLTEKTYKPILHFQPFVIVAGPNHISSLQNRGYKTFSRWIDESYDSIEDNQTRLKTAVNSARRFYMRSKEDIAQDLYEMIDTLVYNRDHYQFEVDNLTTKMITQIAINLNYCRRN